MEKKLEVMEYRDRYYFNERDEYNFNGINVFKSKVVLEGNKIFTTHPDYPQYNALTVQCVLTNPKG